ncbi:MAG TPA: ATP-binding protein [Pyrinomonadaceae bacterium]|nr:ATP-binding protein [Pyrinomonadaceae bacterium]
MRLPKLFFSFGARLLLVLAALLVATLGVQYYLNLREQHSHSVVIAEQEQALTASIALANESITSVKYMFEIEQERGQELLRKQVGRVINLMVVRSRDGRIDDSLDPRYRPATVGAGEYHYFFVSDPAVQLPKLVDAGEVTEQFRRLRPTLLTTTQPVAGEPRTFAIPLQTSDDLNYIVVVLGSSPLGEDSFRGAVRPLLPTLSVLLLATLAASILVWRFTRPVTELSNATARVASGDFTVRARSADRRDEIGRLAATFNETVAQLGRMRELEAQVKQAEQSAMVVRLASAIAHEIRNPLNYINLTLDHLRTTLSPDDPQKRETVARLTAQLKTEVQRINTRITEFLKYTRPARLEIESLDLGETLRDALRMVEVQAGEAGIETSFEQEGEVPPLRGDRESLRSVFTNLIINGMQAMEGAEGGRLRVSLAAADGHARVRVSDTGRGIAADNLSKIFEPYFSTKETGTGLGLAIVKKAVEEHNGRVSVESAQGAGTTFTVELPIEGSDK